MSQGGHQRCGQVHRQAGGPRERPRLARPVRRQDQRRYRFSGVAAGLVAPNVQQRVVSLGIMALVSILLGWLLAGRALAPLRRMSSRAREITEESLDRRLAATADAREDELGELATTFDGVLARLQRAFVDHLQAGRHWWGRIGWFPM